MARRIDAETRAAIVQKYLADEKLSYRDLAKQFGVHPMSVSNIINGYFKDTNGIKPDRNKPKKRSFVELSEKQIDDMHLNKLRENAATYHPRTSDWMSHITPLHQHKMELEQKVEHKQAELDAAKQELRDFTATLKKLMEDTV